ncbi:MAG: hypothetical protein EOM24_19465 [Chloroflexia bacterium]|nr:hypothetical protein [Chloroflexia bacterium]
MPKREAMVTWCKGQGQVKSRFALVPGSSVKGALAHRTAFHWNALNGCFVEDLSPDEARDWDKSEHCVGVMALFGYAKDRETAEGRSRQDTGQAGQVLIEDVHLSITDEDLNARVQSIIHNSIDRFTGGVRNRMLFTEELLYKKPIELSIVLLPGVETSDSSARRAFARALRDLCAGRLALGGGTTKGHGTFTGTPDAATEAWLQQQGETTA